MWSLLAAGAFVAAYAGVRLVERYARPLGLVDLPNTRSSHVVPRPRGGGLGIVAGVIVSALVAPLAGRALPHELWMVVAAALAVAGVGLWDDVRGLGVWPRLVVQTIAAVAVVASVGSIDRLPLPPPADLPLGPLGPFVTVLWIVGVTNFFNFMDGLDGLAAGQALITLAAFACVVWPANAAGLAIVAAAASLAFLWRNWSPARIFLGDVGSAFLGFLLAALPLAADGPARSPLVLLVWTSLALFLLDPIATLIARARRGAVVGASHREHAYQQFVAPSASHALVVTRLLTIAAGLSALAVAAAWYPVLAWPAVTAALAAFTIEWRLATRRRQPSA
jgi:UDP-N-acetylmuramyl pentapeptide phosphotransferase/UDP-N-acetylglucosamine-1-phosphate transferase